MVQSELHARSRHSTKKWIRVTWSKIDYSKGTSTSILKNLSDKIDKTKKT